MPNRTGSDTTAFDSADPIVVAALRDAVLAMCENGQTSSEMREHRLSRTHKTLCKLAPQVGQMVEEQVNTANRVPLIRPDKQAKGSAMQQACLMLATPDAARDPSVGALSWLLVGLATPGMAIDLAHVFDRLNPQTRALGLKILDEYGRQGSSHELLEIRAILTDMCVDMCDKVTAADHFNRMRSKLAKRMEKQPDIDPVRFLVLSPGDWNALLDLAVEVARAEFPLKPLPTSLPVDPELPADFDCTSNDERDASELDAWWDVPYAITQGDGTLLVRCLDGGAHDRSTYYGQAQNTDLALLLAREKLEIRQQRRVTPLPYFEGGLVCSLKLEEPRPDMDPTPVADALPLELAAGYLKRLQDKQPQASQHSA